MADHLLEAVEAVLVHDLAHVRARPLVLHPRLDEVDGVDGGGAGRSRHSTQREPVHGFHDLDEDAALLWALKKAQILLIKLIP